MHVTNIHYTLAFGVLLSKHPFKTIFESDKFTLSNRMFVSKGYLLVACLSLMLKVNLFLVMLPSL